MNKNNTSLLLILTILSFICNIVFVPSYIATGIENKSLKQDTTSKGITIRYYDSALVQSNTKLFDHMQECKTVQPMFNKPRPAQSY